MGSGRGMHFLLSKIGVESAFISLKRCACPLLFTKLYKGEGGSEIKVPW
jgi:hypothetical protein